MYIIHQTHGAMPLYHKIGQIILDGPVVQVQIITTSPEAISAPGGTLTSEWTNSITISAPETISVSSVAQALINEIYTGGEIVSEEEFEILAKKKYLSYIVKSNRDKIETQGITTSIGVIETDEASQRKINGAVTMALILGNNFSMNWRAKNNSIHSLDKNTMISIGLAVAQHINDCQERKNELDAEIEEAETLEELDLIEVNEGWPS